MPGKGLQPLAQLDGCRSVGPQRRGVAVVSAEYDPRGLDEPGGHHIHKPMQLRFLLDSRTDAFVIRSQLGWA
jgi:hypothetical protein